MEISNSASCFTRSKPRADSTSCVRMKANFCRSGHPMVRRMKFNPKTGLPCIDPETGKPYIEHEYSDALMCLLLKRYFPDNYKEQRRDVHVTSNVNNIVVLP